MRMETMPSIETMPSPQFTEDMLHGSGKQSPHSDDSTQDNTNSTPSVTSSESLDTMPGEPCIRRRNWVYYLPHPLPEGINIPYSSHVLDEDPFDFGLPGDATYTLMLESAYGCFIDIGIFKPLPGTEQEVVPNRGGPRTRLEHAYAGNCTTTVYPPAADQNTRRQTGMRVYEHWIDSRYHVGGTHQPPLDERDWFFELVRPTSRDLEVGFTISPLNGRTVVFEQCWSPVPVLPLAPGSLIWSVVLEAEDRTRNFRGMVIRLGTMTLGIAMCGDAVAVEQWVFVEGHWWRQVRVGDLFIPCGVLFLEERLILGLEVCYGPIVWRMTECVRFLWG